MEMGCRCFYLERRWRVARSSERRFREEILREGDDIEEI
jgi:hypothetical protein